MVAAPRLGTVPIMSSVFSARRRPLIGVIVFFFAKAPKTVVGSPIGVRFTDTAHSSSSVNKALETSAHAYQNRAWYEAEFLRPFLPTTRYCFFCRPLMISLTARFPSQVKDARLEALEADNYTEDQVRPPCPSRYRP